MARASPRCSPSARAPGSTLTVLASGPDEGEALAALQEAVAAGLGEEEDEHDAGPAVELPSWSPSGPATSVPGIAASPGIAIGPLWHLKRRNLLVERTAKDPAAEERKRRSGIESARIELRDLYEEVKAKSGAGKASIFRRARSVPRPTPSSRTRRSGASRRGHLGGVELAPRRPGEGRGALAKLDDPLLAARAADMRRRRGPRAALPGRVATTRSRSCPASR